MPPPDQTFFPGDPIAFHSRDLPLRASGHPDCTDSNENRSDPKRNRDDYLNKNLEWPRLDWLGSDKRIAYAFQLS